MTRRETNKKLPGSRLHQFSEKYFEQRGLERIALPIIADLQQEYSNKPHTSLMSFLILLRGYFGFWMAIVLYSIASDEGNIRIFKSMGFNRLLGTAVGAVVALLSWKGNQTHGLVSMFPDALTVLALLCFLCLAVWFCARQTQSRRFLDIWRVSWKISLPVIFILWPVQIFLQFKLWSRPYDLFGATASFLLTLASVSVSRMIACSLVRFVFALSKNTKAI
jgi:hypothetical protein